MKKERGGAAARVSLLLTAVPKRRGLHEAGAENGGDAEEDEGSDVHGALPRLLFDICRSVGANLRGKQGLCAASGGKRLCLAHLHRPGVGIRRGGVLSLSRERDYGADMA